MKNNTLQINMHVNHMMFHIICKNLDFFLFDI
jgi:hypothetical protein